MVETATLLSRRHDCSAGELVLRICGTVRDGQLVRLRSAKCSVGSDSRCTLRLRARGVAAMHCLIIRSPQGAFVRRWAADTRLNGRSFQSAQLMPGDRLSVGPIEFDILETGSGSPSHNSATCCDSILDADEAKKFAPAPTAAEMQALEEAKSRLQADAVELETQRRRWEQECRETADANRLAREELLQRQADLDRQAGQQAERQRDLDAQRAAWQAEQADAQARLVANAAVTPEPSRESTNREAELNERESALAARAAELVRRESEQTLRDEALGQRDRELTQRNAELAEHAATLAARETALTERESQLAQREADVQARTESLQRQATELESLQQQFEQQRAARQTLTNDAASPRQATIAMEQTSAEPPAESPRDGSPVDLKAVLQKFGKLPDFDEDEQPSSHDAPSPDAAEAPARRPAASDSHHAAETDDDSIHSYMAKLLQRVGASAATAPPDTKSPAISLRRSESPRATAVEVQSNDENAAAGSDEASHRNTGDMSPRAVAPEKIGGLAAMRALANMSMQSALQQHHVRRLNSTSRTKLFTAGIAAAIGLAFALLWFHWKISDMAIYGALACFAVAVLWGAQFAIIKARLLFDKGQRALAAATAPQEPEVEQPETDVLAGLTVGTDSSDDAQPRSETTADTP